MPADNLPIHDGVAGPVPVHLEAVLPSAVRCSLSEVVLENLCGEIVPRLSMHPEAMHIQ